MFGITSEYDHTTVEKNKHSRINTTIKYYSRQLNNNDIYIVETTEHHLPILYEKLLQHE